MNPRSVPDLCPKRRLRGRFLPARLAKKAVELPIPSIAEYQDWMSYAFDAMDVDRDGVLTTAEQPGGRGKPMTRDEHRARLAERFRRQDLDRDGWLSAKELAAPPQ
jgi:hypothetical protein